jgi:hypothetical protein
MKTIKKWQKEFKEACEKRFPDSKQWTDQDRLLSIMRQLADVSGGVQKEQGIYHPNPKNKTYDNPNHRLAALIAETLILIEKRNFDLEKELQEVLNFYNENKPLSK